MELLSPAPQVDSDADRGVATHSPPLADSAPPPPVKYDQHPSSSSAMYSPSRELDLDLERNAQTKGVQSDFPANIQPRNALANLVQTGGSSLSAPEAPPVPAMFRTATGCDIEIDAHTLQRANSIFEEKDDRAPLPTAAGPPIGEHGFRGWNPAEHVYEATAETAPSVPGNSQAGTGRPGGWSMGGLGPPEPGLPLDTVSCPGRFGQPAAAFGRPVRSNSAPFKPPRPARPVDSPGGASASRPVQVISPGQRLHTAPTQQSPGAGLAGGRLSNAVSPRLPGAAPAYAAATTALPSSPATRGGGVNTLEGGAEYAAGGAEAAAEGGARERRTGPILLGKGSRGAFRRLDWLRGAAGPAQTTVQVSAGGLGLIVAGPVIAGPAGVGTLLAPRAPVLSDARLRVECPPRALKALHGRVELATSVPGAAARSLSGQVRLPVERLPARLGPAQGARRRRCAPARALRCAGVRGGVGVQRLRGVLGGGRRAHGAPRRRGRARGLPPRRRPAGPSGQRPRPVRLRRAGGRRQLLRVAAGPRALAPAGRRSRHSARLYGGLRGDAPRQTRPCGRRARRSEAACGTASRAPALGLRR